VLPEALAVTNIASSDASERSARAIERSSDREEAMDQESDADRERDDEKKGADVLAAPVRDGFDGGACCAWLKGANGQCADRKREPDQVIDEDLDDAGRGEVPESSA
jgi:hypothetical protein